MAHRQHEVELRIGIGDGHIILTEGDARHDISRFVSGVALAQTNVGDIPRLTVTMLAPQLVAKLRGQVEVDAETAQALVALGWTPPPEPQPETPGDPDCPNAAYHGNPHRYCACGWIEATP